MIFHFPWDMPAGSLRDRPNQGETSMLVTRRIDVLAIFASFAFIGAILLGML